MQFLIVLLAFLFLLLSITCNLSPVSAHTGFQIIKMTPNGFEPQELMTDTNSVVMFVNRDTTPRWPASNIHPTHELYSEFDPKAPVEVGASWAFKPKKAGIFKFHDHLNPHFRGTLTVNTESGTTNQTNPFANWLVTIKDWFIRLTTKPVKVLDTSEFKNLSTDQQIEAIKNRTDQISPEDSWQFLKATFKGQTGTLGNIHDLAHLTGSLVYEKKGLPGLSICSSDFAFGCYHGFLDKAFEKSLDGLDRAEAACAKLGSSGPYGSCVHGIGHGIASFYQTNDLDSSLKSCQQLINGQQFCFDGVFMEFQRAAPLELYSKDSPEQPCDNLAKIFSKEVIFACGRNQPTVLMNRFNFTFEKVAEVCLESKSKDFKEACIDSLGFKSAQGGNSDEIVKECQKIEVDEFVARCTKSGAGELIFQEAPNWQTEAPKTCASLNVKYFEECRVYMDNLIKDYGR